jgi:hypothetical protein
MGANDEKSRERIRNLLGGLNCYSCHGFLLLPFFSSINFEVKCKFMEIDKMYSNGKL